MSMGIIMSILTIQTVLYFAVKSDCCVVGCWSWLLGKGATSIRVNMTGVANPVSLLSYDFFRPLERQLNKCVVNHKNSRKRDE